MTPSFQRSHHVDKRSNHLVESIGARIVETCHVEVARPQLKAVVFEERRCDLIILHAGLRKERVVLSRVVHLLVTRYHTVIHSVLNAVIFAGIKLGTSCRLGWSHEELVRLVRLKVLAIVDLHGFIGLLLFDSLAFLRIFWGKDLNLTGGRGSLAHGLFGSHVLYSVGLFVFTEHERGSTFIL